MAEYTDRELMVIAAGREIRDGDLVFVGMRLPLLAFAFAKRTPRGRSASSRTASCATSRRPRPS